jgi:hypothetical protein
MRHKWTHEEIEYLKINYPKYGAKYCAKVLGLTDVQIHSKMGKLKIRIPKSTKNLLRSKSPDKCNINPELFYNLKNKEIVYLLGLMWADGFLNPSSNGYNHNLGFTMVKEDLEVIKPTLDFIGKWYYYERKQPNPNWKPSINIITNNKRIFDFLVEHDYDKKSHISANKILEKIPDNLKHYFFLGLIDGDGCFYYYKPEKGSTLRQFTLASTYEQDWSYFENLCGGLDISYKIKRTKGKKSSSSCLRITNKGGIKRLGNYIYQTFNDDNMGLNRKYEKYKLIINS